MVHPLMFHRCSPVFASFDLLWLNGKDLRGVPLVERKKRLRQVAPAESPCVLHVDFIRDKGKELFQLACERDLEGVVGKWAQGTYQDAGRSTSWGKVKNASYTQVEGRGEPFEGKGQPSRVFNPALVLR
jgi:bifunctional non-homologous end joining protein LigD